MSQSHPIPVNAVVISGIAFPVQKGKTPPNHDVHMYIEKNGSRIDISENHQNLRNLRKLSPTNHIANGKLPKKPTDTVKWISPAFSENRPIAMRKNNAIKKGISPIFVGKSLIALVKQNMKTNNSIPLRTSPTLNTMAAGNPLL